MEAQPPRAVQQRRPQKQKCAWLGDRDLKMLMLSGPKAVGVVLLLALGRKASAGKGNRRQVVAAELAFFRPTI
jgi:hypothetical protein